MSCHSRILRRAYTGNLSLKTTDHCKTTSLLPSFSPSSPNVSPRHGEKLENGVFLCELENVLSPLECGEIITNGDKCIFEDMSDKYRFGKQRNSSRVLVLDEVLAVNLWENIKPVLSKEMEEHEISNQPLGFNVTKGEWELHSLNEAMRISKYSSKNKEYFGPHKDAQYCPNGDQRSLFTLLVYLNDGFHGGETCFYFPKNITQNARGMTTQEEIDAFGGLKEGFDCVKIVPKVGHAVLFSQNILHESLPILKGTKYILKTDVVVKRHSKQYGFAVGNKEKDDYLTCLSYFREAQQQELQGNFHEASDLYERALSIRYCFPRSLQTAASDPVKNEADEQSECVLLPLEVWQYIFNFLPGYDAENLVYAYPQLRLAKESCEKHERNKASSLFGQKYLPKVNYQKGIITNFEFPDADFFRENASGCCQVVAMYSFFLLGHKPEDDVYTVRYNPDTQDVCAVALETLLTDVFYNRRCYGSFYNVCQQDSKMKDPKKDFEASVDRNYMLLRHGAEFSGVELPDSFHAKSTAYPGSDDESNISEEEEQHEVEKEMEDESEEMEDESEEMEKEVENEVQEENGMKERQGQESKREKEAVEEEKRDGEEVSKENIMPSKKQKEIYDSVPFYGEIDKSLSIDILVRLFIQMQSRISLMPDGCELEFEDLFENMDEVTDVYFETLKNINGMDYAPVSSTLVSKLKEPLHVEKDGVCICFLGPNDEMLTYMGDSCTTEFYNHLVFDFQKSQLSVKCGNSEEELCGNSEEELLHPGHFESISEEQEAIGCTGEPVFYQVDIKPILSPCTSFNHASCQCGNPRFEVHEYYNIKNYPYLDKIQLVARELNGKMLVWSVYGGIVAL